jgi:hypothetical protein
MSNNLDKLRSVINKYTDEPSGITENVCSLGEIVISTQKGGEGVYIKNNVNEIVKIGGNVNQYISKSQYDELIEKGEIYIMNDNGNPIVIKYDETVYYMVYEGEEEEVIDFNNSSKIILKKNYYPFETVIIESSTTLYLNDKVMKGAPAFKDETDGSTNSYGLWVKSGGEITIIGNGTIEARDADYSMAVWANGGSVIISGGTYINHGDGCDLIYVSNGGKVEIYGGEFISNGPATGTVPGTKNPYSALNIKDRDSKTSSITVYGGRFFKFNPANNVSEGEGTNFVAEGYKSVQNGDWWEVIKIENE